MIGIDDRGGHIVTSTTPILIIPLFFLSYTFLFLLSQPVTSTFTYLLGDPVTREAVLIDPVSHQCYTYKLYPPTELMYGFINTF